MAYNRLPDNLPEILRSQGLKVTVLPGWKTRGRPASTGGFDPVGVLCHHTATSVHWAIAAVLRLLTGGRTGLPGPLAQIGLGRNGRVYIIAAGRANHAGRAKASGTVAEGDGNELYIGIEAFNNGVGEPWPDAQYNAYVLLCAVLSVFVTGNSHRTVRAHKETSTTGKIDPTFNMEPFRDKVAAVIHRLKSPKPQPEPSPAPAPTPKPQPTPTPPKDRLTVSQIAVEVLAGKWGNDPERSRKLRQAGYNASEVQAAVNLLLNPADKPKSKPKRKPRRKSIAQIANEVIDGKWGNGEQRLKKLRQAGYNPNKVQAAVNRKLSGKKVTVRRKKSTEEIAQQAIEGRWGNDPERSRRLRRAGYNPEAVQAEVNRRLRG